VLTDSVKAVLLDIEGTTTPISYVYHRLFPYVTANLDRFLAENAHEPAIQEDLRMLREEFDKEEDVKLSWPEGDTYDGPVKYVTWLMLEDRKSTGLKALQGHIWKAGYESGVLKGDIFPDVKPAFERWTKTGKKVFIFSSGSVLAQKLIFGCSKEGDLSPFISGFFDTETGPKRVAESYRKIAAAAGFSPEDFLFLSDIPEELTAAEAAGMKGVLAVRPGNNLAHFDGEKVGNFDLV
jgi:enolase-phosphatase E1